jgi:hypothetical protein
LEISYFFWKSKLQNSVVLSSFEAERSKHIDVRYHYVVEKFEKGFVKVEHVSGNDNLADIFTKPVSKVVFQKFVSLTKDYVVQFHNNEAACYFTLLCNDFNLINPIDSNLKILRNHLSD